MKAIALVVTLGCVLAGAGWAAQQTVAGKLFLVKNPKADDPGKRKILYLAKEAPSDNTVVGDPVVDGASLRVTLDSQTQCFSMPATGWRTLHGIGYRYQDPTGSLGPVKTAFIKRNGKGVFLNKVVIKAKFGTGPQPHITVVPPNPGVEGDTNFHLGTGDQYCASFPASPLSPNNDKTYRVKNAPEAAGCAIPACSASGAFL